VVQLSLQFEGLAVRTPSDPLQVVQLSSRSHYCPATHDPKWENGHDDLPLKISAALSGFFRLPLISIR